MRDIKQAFWIAGQNFYGWKKSPRIWMTFILAAILCLMLSDQIISHAIKYETILQVFEPFIWTYGEVKSPDISIPGREDSVFSMTVFSSDVSFSTAFFSAAFSITALSNVSV